MSAANVQFYEKLQQLQEKQHRCENKRMELDMQLSTQATSDSRLARLRENKLQNYWRKICEDEKKSQWRNEQLLKDVERVEHNLSMLLSRTDKLRQMKRQYEDYVERNYPNWKEKILLYQETKKELQRKRGSEVAATPNGAGYVDIPGAQGQAYHISNTLPHFDQSPRSNKTPDHSPRNGSQTSHDFRPAGPSYNGHFVSHNENESYLNSPVSNSHAVGPSGDRDESFHEEPSLREEPSDISQTPRKISVHSTGENGERRRSSEHSDHGSLIRSPRSGLMSARSVQESMSPRSPMRTPDPDHSHIEERSVYLEAEVTVEGLCNMLQCVEEVLSSSPDDLYRCPPPAISVRKEIIFNANKGAPLSYMDPGSVSMVVLDQLPLLAYGTEGGCLLPDSLLFNPPVSPTNIYIKSKLHPASHTFWDSLYHHFIHLLKHDIMTPTDIANIFAPLIIEESSPYEEKACGVIEALLESVGENELLHSPPSTSSFSTLASPRKPLTPHTVNTPHVEEHRQEVHREEEHRVEERTRPSRPALVPQLSLPASDGDLDTDQHTAVIPAADDHTPAMTNGTTQLTQTAAYRQLLTDTMSSQKSVSYVDSDASSDDIENQLALDSPRRGKKDMSEIWSHSSDFIDDLTLSSSSAPSKPSWLTDMQQKQAPPPSNTAAPSTATPPTAAPSKPTPSRPAPTKPTQSAVTVEEEFDANSTGGYVPSGLDTGKSARSSAFSLSSSARNGGKKPAFMYGDSDTDEDVDIPTAQDEDKDDFEFYG